MWWRRVWEDELVSRCCFSLRWRTRFCSGEGVSWAGLRFICVRLHVACQALLGPTRISGFLVWAIPSIVVEVTEGCLRLCRLEVHISVKGEVLQSLLGLILDNKPLMGLSPVEWSCGSVQRLPERIPPWPIYHYWSLHEFALILFEFPQMMLSLGIRYLDLLVNLWIVDSDFLDLLLTVVVGPRTCIMGQMEVVLQIPLWCLNEYRFVVVVINVYKKIRVVGLSNQYYLYLLNPSTLVDIRLFYLLGVRDMSRGNG